jgi:phage terminase large subunit-like protein
MQGEEGKSGHFSDEQKRELLLLLQERDKRLEGRGFYHLFPDEDSVWDGPKTVLFNRGEKIYGRHRYPKSMEFFEACGKYREVGVMSGNRTGKTVGAGFLTATCLTGQYPDWWKPHWKHYPGPIEAWVAGTTNETTRDILQKKLFGPVIIGKNGRKALSGTGLVPQDCIINPPVWKAGVVDLIDSVGIRHVSGGISYVGMKSYNQGRLSFEGTEKHLCIAEGELVQMADGTLRPIEQVRIDDVVLSLDGKGNVVKRKVTAVFDMGERDCIQVLPKQGTPLMVTPDHEVFRGYNLSNKIRADEADKIAQPIPGSFWPDSISDREDYWYVWAALVVAEGTISQRKVTNGNIEVMERAIAMLPPEARVRRLNFDEKHNHVPDWYLYWDEFWEGISPALSHTQTIPDWVFTSSKEKVRLFLRWLYMGDGWVNGKSVGYATTSRTLQQQIVVLLNRLGVRACVFLRRFAAKDWREQYWVAVQRSDDVIRFLEEIGLEGKQDASDLVMVEAQRRAESKLARSAHLIKVVLKHNRGRFKQIHERVRLKTSKLRAIEVAQPQRVYDISVEGEHRFFAGTSLVKNCWLDEEPPLEIFGECVIRTMTVQGGLIMLTFTPLNGLSDTAVGFMPGGAN